MEQYQMKLINQPSTSGRAGKLGARSRRQVIVHVDNLRTRPLTRDDRKVITACVPELYGRIKVGDLSSPRLVDLVQLSRPKSRVHLKKACECVYDHLTKEWRPVCNYRPVDDRVGWRPVFRPEYLRCVCVRYDTNKKRVVRVRPPTAVVTTQNNILFQEFSGSLVTPAHPVTLTPAPSRWTTRRGNQIDSVEVSGQQLARVISSVHASAELGGRVVPRQWRLSVYRTDGQMQLSVFCSFPGEKVRRALFFSDGAPSPSTTQETTSGGESIARDPPRTKVGLRL